MKMCGIVISEDNRLERGRNKYSPYISKGRWSFSGGFAILFSEVKGEFIRSVMFRLFRREVIVCSFTEVMNCGEKT
jgi:hypothetical protein